MRRETRSFLVRYGTAVVCVAATLLLEAITSSWRDFDLFLLLAALAVVISAFVGGIGPGILSTVLGATVASFIIAPIADTERSPLRLLAFVSIGISASFLGGSVRARRRRSFEEARAARESEALYRRLVDTCGEGAWVLDASGKASFVSQGMADMLGYSTFDLIGTPMLGWVDALDYPEAERLIQQRTVGRTELRFRRQDSSFLWAVVSISPLLGRQRESLGALVTVRDVTELRRAEEDIRQYLQIIRNMQIGLHVYRLDDPNLDSTLRLVAVNPASSRLTGLDAEEALNQTIDRVLPHLCQRGMTSMLASVIHSRTSYEVDAFDSSDGKVGDRLWSLKIFPLPNDSVGMLFEDITERKRSERALRAAKEDLQKKIEARTAELWEANEKLTGWLREIELRSQEISLLSEMGGLLQACLTLQEVFTTIPRCIRQLFPGLWGSVCIIDSTRERVVTVASWGDAPSTSRSFGIQDCWALRRERLHEGDDSIEGPHCQHLASESFGWYLCIPLMSHGEALGILHLQEPIAGSTVNARAIEVARRMAPTVADHIALAISNLRLRESLRNQAIRDPLTGLFNRRYLEESFEREIRRAARNQTTLSVILIDVDHFKQFNDTHGHLAGDALLRELGSFLNTNTRGGDIACRYGGEEFVLVMPETPFESCIRKSEQLREGIKQLSIESNGISLGPVTVSLGVAAFPLHGSDAMEVVEAADSALYRAKAEGRDRVVAAPVDSRDVASQNAG